MSAGKCPVCNGPAGNYRFGACGPTCDFITGDDPGWGGFITTAVVLTMVVIGLILGLVLL